jgi:hypothetical protein
MIKVSVSNQMNMQKHIGLTLLFVCIATIMIAGCTSQPTEAATAAPVHTPAPIKVVTTQAPVTIAATIATPVSTVKENTATLGEINAALKAKSYLRTIAFSRKGLTEQLEYEGFTTQQAEYGVQAVGY